MSPADQQKYTERQTQLEQIYKPQVENINQQIAQLPSMYEAQKSSLQQAKENAFRDITKQASRGGMFFTGFTPREQARYLGERYLPGMQQLTQQESAARQGLLGQISALQGQQRASGLSYLDYLEGLRRADEIAARQAAATRAAASAGAFDIQSIIDALNKGDEEPTPTGELNPEYDYVRTQIENSKSLGKLADKKVAGLINLNKQFILGIGAKRNATENAKLIARNRLNIFKQILGEAKYKSLGGI